MDIETLVNSEHFMEVAMMGAALVFYVVGILVGMWRGRTSGKTLLDLDRDTEPPKSTIRWSRGSIYGKYDI